MMLSVETCTNLNISLDKKSRLKIYYVTESVEFELSNPPTI